MTYDVIIIGSGIAGASAAYFLSDTASVLLLEAEDQPGYHATGRSAAVFADDYGNATVRALTAASRPFLETPPPGFADHPLLKPRGCLYLAPAGQEDTLAEILSDQPALTKMSGADAQSIVAPLRSDRIVAALFDPRLSDIDAHALHHGFLRGATGRGTKLVTGTRVTGLTHEGDHWAVIAGDAIWHGKTIVNAAGAWAVEIAAIAGVDAPTLHVLRRSAAVLAPPKGFSPDWPFVLDAAETFYFKPESGQIVLSPCDETPVPPGDARPDDLDLAIGIDRLQQIADYPVRRIQHAWAGLRTFSADRSPIVGFDSAAPGFFWLAGQGGYGIQTSPGLGQLAAALLTGGDGGGFGVSTGALSPHRKTE